MTAAFCQANLQTHTEPHFLRGLSNALCIRLWTLSLWELTLMGIKTRVNTRWGEYRSDDTLTRVGVLEPNTTCLQRVLSFSRAKLHQHPSDKHNTTHHVTDRVQHTDARTFFWAQREGNGKTFGVACKRPFCKREMKHKILLAEIIEPQVVTQPKITHFRLINVPNYVFPYWHGGFLLTMIKLL